MSIAFVDRNPFPKELEKLRLLLSTYQDGSGQLLDTRKTGQTLPGWRDFERAVALALGGRTVENKYIFDIVLFDVERPGLRFGLSCKMRRELDRTRKNGRVTIELSNSEKKFWQRLKAKNIDQTNYRDYPFEVGIEVIEEVQSWHRQESVEQGGPIDLDHSSYLVLSWNSTGLYQLHQFPLILPNPHDLVWYCPMKKTKNLEEQSQRITGNDESGTLFEWYGTSGGQLKYYPHITDAIWQSEPFRLESLPDSLEHGILRKASEYFPELWERCCK